jgi:hypothetical protein
MKKTVLFSVLTLSLALFFMSFTAVPSVKAEEGCPCVYLKTYGCDPLGGNKYHCYASIGTTCNVKWAALWVELWVDGVPIPPIDVASPFSQIVQTNTGDIYFHAWVTHQCNPGCCTYG